MQDFNWNKLQNGSDIRGVALEGVPNENVNLTPAVAKILGQSFAIWLSKKVAKAPADRKSTRLNSSHVSQSRMPSSA